MRLSDLWTLASALSFLRLAIAATFAWLEPTPWLLPAYVVALLTDVLDGWVARRRGTCSAAGAVLDAWCDKALHVNLGIVLVVAGRMPSTWMIALFARELLQAPLIFPLAYRFRTGKGRPPQATALGRAASIGVALALALVVSGLAHPVAIMFAGLLSVASGLHYAWRYAVTVYVPKDTADEEA